MSRSQPLPHTAVQASHENRSGSSSSSSSLPRLVKAEGEGALKINPAPLELHRGWDLGGKRTHVSSSRRETVSLLTWTVYKTLNQDYFLEIWHKITPFSCYMARCCLKWFSKAYDFYKKKKIKGFKKQKGMLKLQKPKGQLGNQNNTKLDFGAGSELC